MTSACLRGRLALGLLLVLVGAPVGAITPELRTTIDPMTVTVGDPAVVTLTVVVPAGAPAPQFPTWGSTWGGLEVRSAEPVVAVTPPRSDGAAVYQQRVTVVGFDTGPQELPPQTLTVGKTSLHTPAELRLQIASVLPASEPGQPDPPPRAPAPPRPLPVGAAFWWATAVAGLLAVGSWLWARFHVVPSTPGAGAVTPSVAPWPEFEAALVAARGAATPEAGHVVVSLALRRFVGRSLGFPAVESTTAEIRRHLQNQSRPSGWAKDLTGLLAACDAVKFARAPASPELLTHRIEDARLVAARLEEQLAPVLPPLPPGPPIHEARR